MQYQLINAPSLQLNTCLVIGIVNNQLPECVHSLDKSSQGLLTRLLAKLKEPGDLLCQAELEGKSLVLIHCGDSIQFTLEQLAKRLQEVYMHLSKTRTDSATLCLPTIQGIAENKQLEHMILTLEAQYYQFHDFKSKATKKSLTNISFYLPDATEQAIAEATSIAHGVQLARTLANLPPNICTPNYLAEQAQALAQQLNLNCKILNHDQLKKLGAGALLAVGQGSQHPPVLIEMQYQGSKNNEPPIVLVGKGITFDSGGLTLKPGDAMMEMKYDMCGAASVLGTLKACALLKLPIHVIGLIASAENMPSGTAMRPGDIITSLSGQTIEVLNTDAEGRLILADALTYAEQFNPQFVIDIATLTGAIIVALGSLNSGLMTEDDALAELILLAAQTSGDKTWRMPLDKHYGDVLESPFADMINAAFDRSAGSIVAACFLSRFTKNYRWAHLDVAGSAFVMGKNRQATGRPVPLLIEVLRHAAAAR